jgi:putative aldouronate transport system permease protein
MGTRKDLFRQAPGTGIVARRGFQCNYLWVHRRKYALMLPGIAFFIIFRYIPLIGNVMAFEDFNFAKGMFASPWIGFDNFRFLFTSGKFLIVLRNTIIISLMKLFWGFPVPVILALLLNEVRFLPFKRMVQSIIYLPHFFSWPIIAGLIVAFLSPDHGPVTALLRALGQKPIFFLASTAHFRGLLVVSDIWKEAGWGTIIYLAALAGIDPQLYEAGVMDGANRVKLTWHISLPGIMSTIVTLLVLRTGYLLELGFDQIFVLYNSSVYEIADILETYVYRIGLVSGRYSFAAAAAMFQSVVGFILIMIVNSVARRLTETSIF